MNSSLKGKNEMSSADKIMKNIFSGEFEDVRTAKRKKSKKIKKNVDIEKKDGIITSNDEGTEIINDGPKFVSWKDKNKRKTWQFDPNKPVSDWKAWDLFEFAHNLYVKKYNEDWDLRRQGNSLVILQIFEKLERELGSNNYLMMRDYVIYFFEKHIDKFKRRKTHNDGFFDHMNRKDVIRSFCHSYDYRKNFKRYEGLRKKDINKVITNADLENAYILSIGTLVSDFGIVIAANWLVAKKKFKKKDTVKMIFNACKSMYDKDVFHIVVKSTEKNSPYPDWLMFKDPSIITNRIDKNIKINVEFLESGKNKLAFLKGIC